MRGRPDPTSRSRRACKGPGGRHTTTQDSKPEPPPQHSHTWEPHSGGSRWPLGAGLDAGQPGETPAPPCVSPVTWAPHVTPDVTSNMTAHPPQTAHSQAPNEAPTKPPRLSRDGHPGLLVRPHVLGVRTASQGPPPRSQPAPSGHHITAG